VVAFRAPVPPAQGWSLQCSHPVLRMEVAWDSAPRTRAAAARQEDQDSDRDRVHCDAVTCNLIHPPNALNSADPVDYGLRIRTIHPRGHGGEPGRKDRRIRCA